MAAAHHLLLAHGLGMAAIRAEAPSLQAGIVLNFEPKHPASAHLLDLEAADVANDQYNRWFLEPIVGPATIRTAGRGHGAGTVDEVLAGDMAMIAAPIDFLGVNYYTRQVVRSAAAPRPDRPRPTSSGPTAAGRSIPRG